MPYPHIWKRASNGYSNGRTRLMGKGVWWMDSKMGIWRKQVEIILQLRSCDDAGAYLLITSAFIPIERICLHREKMSVYSVLKATHTEAGLFTIWARVHGIGLILAYQYQQFFFILSQRTMFWAMNSLKRDSMAHTCTRKGQEYKVDHCANIPSDWRFWYWFGALC